jgi:molybdopterin adenylyltransferase
MSKGASAIVSILTVSDRASAGVYGDASGPAIEQYLRTVLGSPWRAPHRIVPDGGPQILAGGAYSAACRAAGR